MMKPLLRIFIWMSVLFLFILLIALGRWQWGRYLYKKEIEMTYEKRQQLAPISMHLLTKPDNENLLYRSVIVSGRIDNMHTFLLDNQVVNRKVGFKVLSPMHLDDGQFVLIDRGWLPGNVSRSVLPVIPDISGHVVLKGIFWRPAGRAFLLKQEKWPNTWPKVMQSIDITMMENALGHTLFPWIIVLDHNQPVVLLRQAPVLAMKANRHLGYAVQWWSMALTLFILCIFLKWRGRHDRTGNK